MDSQFQDSLSTKGEISVGVSPIDLNDEMARQISSGSGISKTGANQLDSTRRRMIKRSLDGTGGIPGGEDECGVSHRKKQRLMRAEGLDAPEDSGKTSKASVSSSDQLINQMPSCSASPSSDSKALSPKESLPESTVHTPLKTKTSNDSSESVQMPSNPPEACEQLASLSPPSSHIADTKMNPNIPDSHKSAYIDRRDSPLSGNNPPDSTHQPTVSTPAPCRRSSYDVTPAQGLLFTASPLERQPSQHHVVSTIISNSADTILEFFNHELKLMQAKYDAQMATLQSVHQAKTAAIEIEHQCQLAAAKSASESEYKTLEQAHWRAKEEKEAFKRDAKEKDEEKCAKIEILEDEVESLQAKLLAIRRTYENEYEMQKASWEVEKNEIVSETQDEWAEERCMLLKGIMEERRLRAQSEKARKALREQRKTWGQQTMKYEEEKLGRQRAWATQTKLLEVRFEEERNVRMNEETARRSLEEEKKYLDQRISKLEAENSEFEEAKKRLEVWVGQMQAALLQQAEDDKKRMASTVSAWQEKMHTSMQEEKIKGEKDGYNLGEKDGFEKGEKSGIEIGERDGYERGKAETLQQIMKLTVALEEADKTFALERQAWVQEKKRLEEESSKLKLVQRENIKTLEEEATKTAEKLDQYLAKEIATRWENLMAKDKKRWEAEKACRTAEDADKAEKMERREKELGPMTKKVAVLERQARSMKAAETSAEAHIDAMTQKIKLLEKQVETRKKANEEDLLLGQNATAVGPYSRTEAKNMLEGLVLQGGAGATTAEPTTDQPCYLQ